MSPHRAPAASASPTTEAATQASAAEAPSGYAHHTVRLSRYASVPRTDHARRRQLREELIFAFLPVVQNIARRHSRYRPHSFDDLVQVGTVALIIAIDRWDPDLARGDFLGYLVPCVRGEILRYFRDRTWSMSVPSRLKYLGVTISHATGPLSQQLGRAPRPSDLAAHLGVDLAEVVEALDAKSNYHLRSLDSVDPCTGTTCAEHLGDLDKMINLVEYRVALRPLLDALSERDRSIITMRFFGDLTQTQIAQRLGLSQIHVSRLLSKIVTRLRDALLDNGKGRDCPQPGSHGRSSVGTGLSRAARASR